MAGLGYKEWVAGEQLTAANFQSYFQDQTVMVFASSAARGTALAGVVSEGMVSYLQDVNQLQVYNGTSWGQVTPDVPTASPGTAGIMFGQTTTSGTDHIKLGYLSGGTVVGIGGFYNANINIGSYSGNSNTTGHNSIFIGPQAGGFNTTGAYNTAIGVSALLRNYTGDNNTAIGYAAGFGSEFEQPLAQNTFVGASVNSGLVNWYGNNNIILGYNAAQSTTNVSNQITLGNSSISSLRCQVTSISALSDIRDKKNVEELPYGLSFVEGLKPVSFDWNMRDGAKVDVPDIGFIAQDLAALEDSYDADRLNLTLRDNPDKLEATPGRLIPILVKAIQELSARVKELENAG
jgi:hypothetical protein